MPITIAGSGTITGISAGGLPDGIVAPADLTTGAPAWDSSGNLSFNSGYGASAVAYGCRAWVNFDGTTASPSTRRGSGNVSSVTKNGTGDYTVNFTTAMPDANYGVAYGSASVTSGYFLLGSSTSPTTTAFRFTTWTTTSLQQDNPSPCVAIFR